MRKSIAEALAERVLTLDGAMGTMIQSRGLGGRRSKVVARRCDFVLIGL